MSTTITGERAQTGQTVAQPSGKADISLPAFVPATDIFDSEDEVILSAEIPGADPESVGITLDRQILRITARTRIAAPSGYSLVHAEYRTGDFERSFSVASHIDGNAISAAVSNGVLTVKLPKIKPAPARKIAVQAS